MSSAKHNAYQNAFQNAGQLQSFSYTHTEVGNQTSTFLVLILAFALLVALLRSEARWRGLAQKMAGQ